MAENEVREDRLRKQVLQEVRCYVVFVVAKVKHNHYWTSIVCIVKSQFFFCYHLFNILGK